MKRKPPATRADDPAEVGAKSVEQRTREITVVVKKWVAELKERKSNLNGASHR